MLPQLRHHLFTFLHFLGALLQHVDHDRPAVIRLI
jgi:hypothetical protein